MSANYLRCRKKLQVERFPVEKSGNGGKRDANFVMIDRLQDLRLRSAHPFPFFGQQ